MYKNRYTKERTDETQPKRKKSDDDDDDEFVSL